MRRELIADSVKKALLSSKDNDIGLVVRVFGEGMELGQELDAKDINTYIYPEFRKYFTPQAMTRTQYENKIRSFTKTWKR